MNGHKTYQCFTQCFWCETKQIASSQMLHYVQDVPKHIMPPYYKTGNITVYVSYTITSKASITHTIEANPLPVSSCVPPQPPTHTLLPKMSHPSNVGTPSWRVPCRRGTCRPRGCRALYRCRDAISLSLLFSVSLLSSAGSRVRRSKFSSKIPRANGPYPEGNVNKCW